MSNNRRRCAAICCIRFACSGFETCFVHGGGKRCEEIGCEKRAIGKINRCIRHGGGNRCVVAGCGRVLAGRNKRCDVHGGGIRCIVANCLNVVKNKFDRCNEHGASKRCAEPGCKCSTLDGYDTCIAHGARKSIIAGETRIECAPSHVLSNCAGDHMRRTPKRPKLANRISQLRVVNNGRMRCAASQCFKSAIGMTRHCNEHRRLAFTPQYTVEKPIDELAAVDTELPIAEDEPPMQFVTQEIDLIDELIHLESADTWRNSNRVADSLGDLQFDESLLAQFYGDNDMSE